MKTVIVLAMHGMPPKDFPKETKSEFMRLNVKVHQNPSDAAEAEVTRFKELDTQMREWPRSKENDPFKSASDKIAQDLSEKTGLEVIVGYNEFCAPDCQKAFDAAVKKGADKVIVTTPMVTRGGNHAEEEIPEEIEEARKRHPEVEFVYAWPFEDDEIAGFLAGRITAGLSLHSG